jgi:hypothetical protein
MRVPGRDAPHGPEGHDQGRPGEAGFALGSYAAFEQLGDHAMVMGDLVLLDREIPAVGPVSR